MKHHSVTGKKTPAATQRDVDETEPLVVSPKVAERLLNVGHDKLYRLLGDGELDHYPDANGRARQITMKSIRAYIARQVAATNQVPVQPKSARKASAAAPPSPIS
jgi:hypothetical protein